MAIKDTMNEHSFVDAMTRIRPENFSREGLRALYEYLDDLSDDLGEDIEFDPIALCCEYSEYESLAKFKEEHDSMADIEDVEDIRDMTTLILIEGTDRFITGEF